MTAADIYLAAAQGWKVPAKQDNKQEPVKPGKVVCFADAKRRLRPVKRLH